MPGPKWGPWWQRAIRLPTRRLTLQTVLPTILDPVVWGTETSMTAEATPFRNPIIETSDGNVSEFRWSIDNAPLHARYRVEWKFRNQITQEGLPDVTRMSPAETMRDLGVVQGGDDILSQIARPIELSRSLGPREPDRSPT